MHCKLFPPYLAWLRGMEFGVVCLSELHKWVPLMFLEWVLLFMSSGQVILCKMPNWHSKCPLSADPHYQPCEIKRYVGWVQKHMSKGYVSWHLGYSQHLWGLHADGMCCDWVLGWGEECFWNIVPRLPPLTWPVTYKLGYSCSPRK